MDNRCPHCNVVVLQGVNPGTKESKYAFNGPFFLCPKCSQEIEINQHPDDTPQAFLKNFLSAMAVASIYYLSAHLIPKYIAVTTIAFFLVLGVGIFIRSKSKNNWPRWRKREAAL